MLADSFDTDFGVTRMRMAEELIPYPVHRRPAYSDSFWLSLPLADNVISVQGNRDDLRHERSGVAGRPHSPRLDPYQVLPNMVRSPMSHGVVPLTDSFLARLSSTS